MLDRIALRILRGTAGDCRVRPVRFGGAPRGSGAGGGSAFFRPDFSFYFFSRLCAVFGKHTACTYVVQLTASVIVPTVGCCKQV
jgi:hypothetical protein